MKLIYLSAPFSTGPDSTDKRQKDINVATSWLMKNTNAYIFSPITYEEPIKKILGVNPDKNIEWAFWQPRDGEMVSRCDEVWVLMLRNWENSRGVNYEIEEAKKHGKTIRYIEVYYITRKCPTCGGSGELGPGWCACDYCPDCIAGNQDTGELILRGDMIEIYHGR